MTERGTALVVRGGWEGHSPVSATEAFIPTLRHLGFSVSVHEGTQVYEDAPLLGRVALIVQCVTMGEISPAAVTNLRHAVAAGVGLVGWHGGIVDSFRGDTEYLQLVGGQFVTHPARSGTTGATAADFAVRHRVDITAAGRNHPITSGIESFELETENYWMACDGYNDVLATTTVQADADNGWARDIVSPAIWTRSWGSGRVVVVTPGHDLCVLSDPNVRQIIERGLGWAAKNDH